MSLLSSAPLSSYARMNSCMTTPFFSSFICINLISYVSVVQFICTYELLPMKFIRTYELFLVLLCLTSYIRLHYFATLSTSYRRMCSTHFLFCFGATAYHSFCCSFSSYAQMNPFHMIRLLILYGRVTSFTMFCCSYGRI